MESFEALVLLFCDSFIAVSLHTIRITGILRMDAKTTNISFFVIFSNKLPVWQVKAKQKKK